MEFLKNIANKVEAIIPSFFFSHPIQKQVGPGQLPAPQSNQLLAPSPDRATKG